MSNDPEIKTPGGIIMPNPDYVPPPEPDRSPASPEVVAVAHAKLRAFGGILLPVYNERSNPHIKDALRFIEKLAEQGYIVVKDNEP